MARCAVLHGWALVAALGEARRVDGRRAAADTLVARVAAASGTAGEDARQLAGRVTERPPARG